jgi:hypothetical protein
MRAWQLLACVALCIAVSAAFSVSSRSHEAYSDSGDLVAAASGHGGGGHGGGGHESSGFEESGGMEFGEDHHSKVS